MFDDEAWKRRREKEFEGSKKEIKAQKVKEVVGKKSKKKVDKEDRKGTSGERSEEDHRESSLQVSMEVPMLEKGVMYAEVDTGQNGSINAEMGLMYDEGDAKALVEVQHSCAALLQGDFIDKEMYVTPPKEVTSTRPERREAILWKLVRPLYGLTDASRKWYCRMDKELTKFGGQRSKYNYAIYNLWKDGELQGQILLHVDDRLYGGSDLFHRKVIGNLMRILTVEDEEASTETNGRDPTIEQEQVDKEGAGRK